MLRMSFMEHLQELRSRILRALAGIGVAFVLSLTFCSPLWDIVRQPAVYALTNLGIKPPVLHTITPMEGFTVIWFKLPVLCAIFIASPWILYQVWAFIAPGLYRRERRMAAPFILTSAGLFITGGLFAYFVLFRYALAFLLGIGLGNGVEPVVSISSYFDLFVNVMLGVALVFELPVLIFFLTLLRILSPAFMLRHSRYAILAIFIIAAIVTPTPDAFNLMLFAIPMCMLFYVGIFAGLSAGAAPRASRLPMAENDHYFSYRRPIALRHGAVPGRYQVRLQTGTALAFSDALVWFWARIAPRIRCNIRVDRILGVALLSV